MQNFKEVIYLSINREDIAKILGISPTTVTRALNGSTLVSDKTREKVIKLANEKGYYPSRLGRGHFQKKSYQIGVVIPMLTIDGSSRIEYLAHSINGMSIKARKFDYSVNIIIDENLTIDDLAKNVLTKRVDGLVFLETNYEDNRFSELYKRNIPIILVSNKSPDDLVPHVTKNPKDGIDELLQLIREEQIKTIGFLDGGDEFLNAIECRKYFNEIMKANNIKIEKTVKGNCSLVSGEKAAKEFMKGGIPDLIFCANDLMALGLVRGLQDNGIKISSQVKVCGYDNLFMSNLITPRLTSIGCSMNLMGRKAVELLMKIINGDDYENVVIPTKLFRRDSF